MARPRGASPAEPGPGASQGPGPQAVVRVVRDGGAALWDFVRDFLEARDAFRRIYRRYERRVVAAAHERKVAREHLVLPPDQLWRLFDLRDLEALRDEHLGRLKRQAEAIFGDDGDEGLLDTYCGHAYSEVSILCEEHRAVGRFVQIHDPARYRQLFQEVSGFYPTRLRRLRRFFRQGLRRLEELLPAWSRHRVVIRSAYLFDEGLARRAWREGLEGFYARLYPGGGAPQGYLEAARSFHAAGFDAEAAEAAGRATQALAAARPPVAPALAAEVGAFCRALAASGGQPPGTGSPAATRGARGRRA